MLRRIFKAFHYREFRLVWTGACISSIGTWMQKLAQSWLVLDLTGSGFLLGLDAFLGEIPIFLFSLVGGVVADRMSRRRLLLASQFVQMACAFVLAGLIGFGVVQVWHILCLSFVVGTAQAFGGPAYSALVPSLVKSEDLPNAIALNSIQFNLARVIGPVLGGLALSKLGAVWCFGLNGLSFVAVIISLLLLRIRFRPEPTTETILASMKKGIYFIRSQEEMRSLIWLAFAMTSLGFSLIVFLPVVVREVFHADEQLYAELLSVSGAGSVIGALFIAMHSKREHMGRNALVMLVTFGMLIVGFALSTSVILSGIMLFLSGAALIAVFAQITSLVQLLTTDEMRGRVMSVYNVAFRGGAPIGNLVCGTVIEFAAAPVVLAVNGMLLTLIGLYYLLFHRRLVSV